MESDTSVLIKRKKLRPSFSILMAARNSQETIGLAVKSALVAMNKVDKLLVFLDGCEDDTFLVLDKIKDARLKVHVSQFPVGRSAARNFLSLVGKGAYFAVLDSDDVCLPWRLAITRRLLSKYDAVFGAAFLFGDLPHRIPIAMTYPFTLSEHLAPMVLAYRNPFVHSTSALKRDTIIPGELYQDIASEEYLLWIQMARNGLRLHRTAWPLAAYRFHERQVTKLENFYSTADACPILNAARDDLANTLMQQLKGDLSLPGSDTNALNALARHRSLIIRFEELFLVRLRAFMQRSL